MSGEWRVMPNVPQVESRWIRPGFTMYRLTTPTIILGRSVRSCRELGCMSATLGPLCSTHAGLREDRES